MASLLLQGYIYTEQPKGGGGEEGRRGGEGGEGRDEEGEKVEGERCINLSISGHCFWMYCTHMYKIQTALTSDLQIRVW